jgi:hypothetical protein
VVGSYPRSSWRADDAQVGMWPSPQALSTL